MLRLTVQAVGLFAWNGKCYAIQRKIAMIGNLEPEERVLDMGNSPTDKSKDFIRSGMTLITQIDSDKHLKKARDDRRKDSTETSRDNS